MAKERKTSPEKTRLQVLDEFNHRCAKCGADKPHLHHIDEDPSNNDLTNLIPLCPNCHLTDQHNPTRTIEPDKLRLFRQYKDPTILTPQFHALFRRMRFLDTIDLDCSDDEMRAQAMSLHKQVLELHAFVRVLEMGPFYADQLDQLLTYPDTTPYHEQSPRDQLNIYPDLLKRRALVYCENLCGVRDEVYDLLVELLRFQNWNENE